MAGAPCPISARFHSTRWYFWNDRTYAARSQTHGTAPATRLRFRVTQQTTFPAPSGIADASAPHLMSSRNCRPRTLARAPATSLSTGQRWQPPNQPNGGAFTGVTVSVIAPSPPTGPTGRNLAGTLQLSTPLNPGESIDVRFLYGIQQTGKFRITLNVEVVEVTAPEERPAGATKAMSISRAAQK